MKGMNGLTAIITEDNAIDLMWQPMQLVRVSPGCWSVVPDGVPVNDSIPHKDIEIGVDVALFGMPEDRRLFQCMVMDYGVLVVFALNGNDSKIESLDGGEIPVKFLSETESSLYWLPYRVRKDVN